MHKEKFLEFVGGKEEDLKRYLVYLANSNISDLLFNSIINELKVKVKRDKLKVKVGKLNEKEIRDVMDAINLKEKVFIGLLYYSNLKASELIKLKIKDVKNIKDEIFKVNLENYVKTIKGEYLFEDVVINDMQKALEKGLYKNEIKKNVFLFNLK